MLPGVTSGTGKLEISYYLYWLGLVGATWGYLWHRKFWEPPISILAGASWGPLAPEVLGSQINYPTALQASPVTVPCTIVE